MMLKPLLTLLCIVFLCGVSHSQFTGPSNGICPGDNVTFTCVVTTTLTTTWRIDSGGPLATCTYDQSNPTVTVKCGPAQEFTSSQTDVNGPINNSSLSVDSVDSGLNGTTVTCVDGNGAVIDSRDICVIDVLGSPEIQSASVSGLGDEENMCRLSLEWSEAVVSCAGSVTYTLTATPCLSVSGDCEGVGGSQTTSTTETQITLSVDGSVGLEYDFTVSTCANTSTVYSANLTANSTGIKYSYNYIYNITTSMYIDAVNAIWPRSYVLTRETVYKLIIDEQIINITSEACNGNMCSYTYSSDSLNFSSSVEVEVVGCTTQRLVLENETSFCSPEDLLSPGVDWDPTPIITNGQGVYSFPGGNVTYNGVSLGSTATYRTSEGYLVNGERILEIRCTNNVWRAPVMITNAEIDQETESSRVKEDSQTATIIIGVVCSVVFLFLTIGVLLGVVGVYLRGRLSGPSSLSPPPLPPPVTYEEVGVAREVKSSQDIQLTSNEAYGPTLQDNIPISHNTAYGQVQL